MKDPVTCSLSSLSDKSTDSLAFSDAHWASPRAAKHRVTRTARLALSESSTASGPDESPHDTVYHAFSIFCIVVLMSTLDSRHGCRAGCKLRPPKHIRNLAGVSLATARIPRPAAEATAMAANAKISELEPAGAVGIPGTMRGEIYKNLDLREGDPIHRTTREWHSFLGPHEPHNRQHDA